MTEHNATSQSKPSAENNNRQKNDHLLQYAGLAIFLAGLTIARITILPTSSPIVFEPAFHFGLIVLNIVGVILVLRPDKALPPSHRNITIQYTVLLTAFAAVTLTVIVTYPVMIQNSHLTYLQWFLGPQIAIPYFIYKHLLNN